MKSAWLRLVRTGHARDVAIVACLIVLIVVVVVLGPGSADGHGDRGSAYRNPTAQVAARIPAGWRALERPIDGILYPVQVLAAASFPVTVPHHPRGCHPGGVLGQMPADGVLLKVFEYAARNPAGKPLRVPKLPPRPRRFHYRDAEYGPFECAGPSYKFTFAQAGRAFQAHVWFDRESVDPTGRRQALRILDSFHPTGGTKRDVARR